MYLDCKNMYLTYSYSRQYKLSTVLFNKHQAISCYIQYTVLHTTGSTYKLCVFIKMNDTS